MSHNIAFVQARMGSKRFPGKMTKKLGEFTLIEWVLIRLKKSKLLNQIILTTSKNKENDELISYAKKLNIDFFRGEENNVLNRIDLGGKRARNEELTDKHHDHLIDIETGDIIEFVDDEIEELQKKVAKKLGYSLIDHKMELFGKKIKSN